MYRVLYSPASDMYEVCDTTCGLSAIAAFASEGDACDFASTLADERARESSVATADEYMALMFA